MPLAYHASTSANPNPVISHAFVEVNYKSLESLLRDRHRQMRNNDLQIELEYFSKDYDEEWEIEPRPVPTRANREESRVERNSEGGRPLEDVSRRNEGQGAIFPSLLAAYLGRSKNGQPLQSSLTSIYREDYPLPDGLKLPSHIGSYNGKGDPNNFLHLFEWAIHIQKWLMPVACHMFTYTLKDFARIWWNSQKADKTRYCRFLEDHGHDTNQCRELKHQIEEVVKTGQLAHLVKGIKKEKMNDTQLGEWKKEEKKPMLKKFSVLMISMKCHNPDKHEVPQSKKEVCGPQRGEQSWPLGEVPLDITIGEGPLAVTKTLTFVIVRSELPHNLLLRRTAMQQMGIVVSIVHGAIKFHTPRGVGTVLSEYNSQKLEEEESMIDNLVFNLSNEVLKDATSFILSRQEEYPTKSGTIISNYKAITCMINAFYGSRINIRPISEADDHHGKKTTDKDQNKVA
ncbi:hypothetical protein Tco_0265529 [Tanacetum coccineum]